MIISWLYYNLLDFSTTRPPELQFHGVWTSAQVSRHSCDFFTDTICQIDAAHWGLQQKETQLLDNVNWAKKSKPCKKNQEN